MNASETSNYRQNTHIEMMMYACERVERAWILFCFSTFIANYFSHYFCWDFILCRYSNDIQPWNIWGDKVHFPFLFVALLPPPPPHFFVLSFSDFFISLSLLLRLKYSFQCITIFSILEICTFSCSDDPKIFKILPTFRSDLSLFVRGLFIRHVRPLR